MASADRVGPVLGRLHALHPRLIDLSLERLLGLLAKLDHPERCLPPVIHVAGTNGKGSCCAFLRAIGEAAGLRVHVYTSPHLIRFNERIRLAGEIVSDEALADVLEEIETVNAGDPITVFEITTAAALLLFARVPADLCVLEVGLGGRFDATNVVDHPSACIVASLSLDHAEFLGDTLAQIAFEKVGIAKPGRPLVTGRHEPEALAVIADHCGVVGAPLWLRDRDWSVAKTSSGLLYQDSYGTLELPPPSLLGPHQVENAGLAVAALRASGLELPDRAWNGVAHAEWPARLQRLRGALAARLPAGSELWLDGAHNPGAGQVLAEHVAGWRDRPLDLVIGMKTTKDAAGFLEPLKPFARHIYAVAEPEQHMALPVEGIIAASGGIALRGPTVVEALRQIAERNPGRVLICGSLYLAGEVLKLDR